MITIQTTRFFIAVLTLQFLCACTVTTTTKPYVPGEEPTIDDSITQKNKKRLKLFEKKPGNAVADYQKDRRKGILRIKQYGAPGPTTPYFNRLLKEDLGIDVEVIADGIVSPEMLRYAKEYNSLMVRDIQQKWGRDILAEASRRATIMHEQVRRGGN